jgi:hypothetical protein
MSVVDVSNTVRILDVNEAAATTIDLEEPIIIRGAFDRGKTTWEEVWLTRFMQDRSCTVFLDSRTARGSNKKQCVGLDFLEGQRRRESRGEPPMYGRNVEYLFHTEADISRVSEILGTLDLPPALTQLGPADVYRFYIGPAWSGSLPHLHSHAINALGRGRKRWAVYVGRDTLEHDLLLLRASDDERGTQAAPWFETEWPRLMSRGIPLWEFIQESGDVVFIPGHYLHAVINLEPVVGFMAEFCSTATEQVEESWNARFERIVSAHSMHAPFMETSAQRLLPYMNAHGLGHTVLELGPNRHPLITPDRFDGRIVYVELNDPCVQFLRDKFGDSVTVVKFNLHRAWDAGDNLLETSLAGSLDRDQNTPVSFDSLIMSQIVNYVDFRALLQACVELLAVGGLLFFNNIMNEGGASLFHPRRPKTMEEFLECAVAIGFDPIEVVAEPAGGTLVRHLAVLRRRARS